MRRNLSAIPTKHLQHIVDHDGMSYSGEDYGPYLEEILHILFDRATKADNAAYMRAVKERNRAFHTCGQCQLTVPREDETQLAEKFSKRGDDARSYRHLCKLCRSNREKTRAANKLPF